MRVWLIVNETGSKFIKFVHETIRISINTFDFSQKFIEGYDLFPEKFPIQDTRGILVYIKQDLKAVEVNIEQDFKECVLRVVKVNLRNTDLYAPLGVKPLINFFKVFY
jgi:hypothetical protein